MKLFSILVIALALVVAVKGQCESFPNNLDSYVCRLGGHGDIVVGSSDLCSEVNEQPFATMSEMCYNLMLADGKQCSYAVASYYCSARCPECQSTIVMPCEGLCTDVETRCPSMWANVNCRVANRCITDAICTDIGVNEGNVDKVTGLSGGGGDSGAAPGKPEMSGAVVLAGAAAVVLASLYFN